MSAKISFSEKLQIIKEIYFENHNQSLSVNEIISIENDLNIKFPESLRDFYLMYGGDLDLLKCMYDISTPKELNVENNILIIAHENQNVCSYGIDLSTQKPVYCDFSNNAIKEINQDIEDFLIYLLALQGTEYLSCIGTVDVNFIDEIENCLIKLTKSEEKAVFCDKDGIIAVLTGDEIFICAKNDDCMEDFEAESGLEIDYL